MGEITTQTLDIARQLAPAPTAEASVRQILISEIRRRMNRYELIERRFRRKYRLRFEEFRDQHPVEKYGHSFEIESDYCDWEMAITGLAALKQQLAELGAGESA